MSLTLCPSDVVRLQADYEALSAHSAMIDAAVEDDSQADEIRRVAMFFGQEVKE